MRNRSWGCSVTRTCLKNTVTDPVAVQERSTSAKPASSKGASTRPPEAMAVPTIDQSVTSKEHVDALNTLILRKLAKESFMNEGGGSRKVEYSAASHCNKKVASTWGTLHEARSATVSCKCGSHVGKELFSSFPNLHNNTIYMDTTKSNPGSFDGGKIPEGVGSLMSRIGLDNRKRPEQELPLFQNSSRFDKVPQPRTLVSTQAFLESMPSKDAGEWQGAIVQSSTKEFLSISTEQVTSIPKTTVVNAFARKKTFYGAIENCCIGHSTPELREGSVIGRSKLHVSWAKETFVSIGSAGRSNDKENEQELSHEFGMTQEVQARNMLGRVLDADKMVTNPQASNGMSSMHTVGQMWCIPEANSVGDVRCTESSPYHRCSTMGTHEQATDSSNPACLLTTHELSPLENNLLKPHVNSPVNEEATPEEVIEQTSLHNALIKGMQLRIDEAACNLQKARNKQHSDSLIAGTELIRKIFKDEGVEEVISSKTPRPEQLKTSAHVRWNLRELMQREEIEDDVDANLNALKKEFLPQQGSRELGCLEELARSLVAKQYDTKQEDGAGDHGTPTRLEPGITKLKHEEVQLHDDCREDTKTELNTTPRNQLIAETTSQGAQVQEGRIARRASPLQNHVHSSCPGDDCRNPDAKEENNKLFQRKAPLPGTRKSVTPNDFCDDSAAVRELEVDWGTDRDDLEILLQFLTMKQQLKENRKTDVEAVVQTEAIVRELLARMKLDMDSSPSVDSEVSICFLPRSHAREPVVDDGYGEGGRKRREQVSNVDTSDATGGTALARMTFEDRVDPEVATVDQNQNIDCQSGPAIRRPPFVAPSSSKSQCLQRMAGSTNTRKTTSCVRNYVNQSQEYKAATSPSRNTEEARKRSRRSTVGSHQPESCRTTQSVVGNAIDGGSEEVKSDDSHRNVAEGGSSTGTGMETLDGTIGAAQVMGTTEHDGVPNETKAPHGSPTGNPMPSASTRNLESRSLACNVPAMPPWNYQREKQLPIGRNVQLASPHKRSIPKLPSSPEHRRLCRDSPTRKSSPDNRPSPLSSPQRQQKPKPATATSKSTAAHLGSPKRPSPLSSTQRQQKPRPSLATLVSTAAHVGSPKPSKILGKEEADTTVPSWSHDPDIFPAGISEAVVQESIALAKDSTDPYVDFRDSMLEMMQEKNLWQRQEELQDLLQCFLHLNQPVHHQMIHQAFSDVVSFDSPLRHPHKSSKKERSNAHFSRRSSPSRQLYYEASQPCKSPVRGAG